jgi:hypothetical protein
MRLSCLCLMCGKLLSLRPLYVYVHNNNLFPSPPFIIISITTQEKQCMLSASQAKFFYYVLEQCTVTITCTLPLDRRRREKPPRNPPSLFTYFFLRVKEEGPSWRQSMYSSRIF